MLSTLLGASQPLFLGNTIDQHCWYLFHAGDNESLFGSFLFRP